MADRAPAETTQIDEVISHLHAARHAKRASGATVYGPRGFGHVLDRSRLVEPEAAAVRDAAQRVLAGETLASIVHDWNRQGLKTTTGGPWRANALSALLVQPRLAGLYTDDMGVTLEKWPPIIDRSTHERLVALRSSRRLQRRPPQRSLLTGLLRCGKCGARLHYLVRSEVNQYYRCPGPAAGGCSGVVVKANFTEEFVRDIVIARVNSPEFNVSARGIQEPANRSKGRLTRLEAAIDADRLQLKELASLWADETITRLEWQRARGKVARRLSLNEAKLQGEIETSESALKLAHCGAQLAAKWPELDICQRREVVRAVLDHLVVDPVGGGGGKFRPGRLHPVWRS